jgi:hypothetical protein
MTVPNAENTNVPVFRASLADHGVAVVRRTWRFETWLSLIAEYAQRPESTPIIDVRLLMSRRNATAIHRMA